jgi:hypothetical protein
MISETGLQRTFLAIGSIGRWEYLLHLSCFLIYSDLMLVLGKGLSIGEINLEWLKTNVSLGLALVLLVGYAFTKAFMLPVIDALYNLFVAFPFRLKRIERLPRREVDIISWWAYAMLTRNTPAYRETERLRAKNEACDESSDNSRHLGLLLGSSAESVGRPGAAEYVSY